MSGKGGFKNIEEQFKRMYAVTQAKNFAELASLLGVGPSVVSDAKRRGKIPAVWLQLFMCEYGINPMWLLTGNGEPMLVSGRQHPQGASANGESDFSTLWKPNNDAEDTPGLRT